MKTIEFSNHEKMLVELCVRHMFCALLDKEDDCITHFIASLHNMNGKGFGDQEHQIPDTNDWIAQIPILRSALKKLFTPEWIELNKKFGDESYIMPEETDIELKKTELARSLSLLEENFMMVKLIES